MHLLATNPGKYVRMHDMVLNGNEIGVDTYSLTTQQLMFKYLGFTEEQAKEQFGFLMDAVFGAPHGR
jgi:aspartyl-tRNA synthetase